MYTNSTPSKQLKFGWNGSISSKTDFTKEYVVAESTEVVRILPPKLLRLQQFEQRLWPAQK